MATEMGEVETEELRGEPVFGEVDSTGRQFASTICLFWSMGTWATELVMYFRYRLIFVGRIVE